MRKRRHQAKLPIGIVAGKVIELADGEKGDLVVVLELVRYLGDARLQHRGHVVVPPVDAFTLAPPVGGPTEVGGIDVGRQPLLESVQLVGTHEVHLAGKTGAISGQPQVVCPGRNRGRKLGGVVVDSAVRGE